MSAKVQHFQTIADLSALKLFAKRLSAALRPGDVLLLNGTLGVGKTELCRSLIQALPLPDGSRSDAPVPSPTFTLVQSYRRAIGTIHHFDLYRLANEDELFELGWDEALSDGIALVEWPDRLGSLTPDQAIALTIDTHGTDALGEQRLINCRSPRDLSDVFTG